MTVNKKKQAKNSDERESQVKSTESNAAEETATKVSGEEVPAEEIPGEGVPAAEGQEEQAAAVTEEEKMQADIEYLQARIEALQAEKGELANELLRKQADFENFRKRMQRERQEAIKFANANLLQDIITIIDDFERAIRSSEESRDFDSFHSGIKMIERQFVGMLERKYGLKRMETVGKEFDPQQHEAIGMEESPEVDTQMVLEDYQKGYILNDRVLRHAKVKVAVPVPVGPDAGQSAGQTKTSDAAEGSAARESRKESGTDDSEGSHGEDSGNAAAGRA
jgi:molecular chaperone GrpE